MPEVNAEQREYWNGDESREWVDAAERFDAMLEPFLAPLLDAAAPTTGERVLDVGCGNGVTTLAAAEILGPGEAVGIDLSAAMIENARRRAAERSIANASFSVADAQVATLPGPFDVTVSRFGVMFFDDPAAACANIVGSLGDDGRLAFVCWRSLPENEWVRVQAEVAFAHVTPPAELGADAPGPFRYGDPTLLIGSLERAGLHDVRADPFDTTILLGGRGPLGDTMSFLEGSGMVRRMLGDASPEVQARVLAGIRDALAPFETDEGIRIGAAAWIVTGHRR